ncbi:polyadenylate-binding protein 7 [Lathyrus oleraceus]|nr:polyadenylate-binding protein 7-like [Pisum sativum]
MTDSQKVPAATASLFVGELHSDVTTDQLYAAFSEFKSLVSVHICKDSATGKSLCYGYVNLTSRQEAISAIELKNNSLLNGKAIRVMWSSCDVRKSGKGNVFVKNLAESIDNVGLHDLFQEYGNILSSKIVMSEDGKSKGFGYIQFDSEESANDAIQKMNGSTVRDKQIYVGKFIRKSERSYGDSDAQYTNLYVKNLDPHVTEALLKEKFSSFGKIISLAIAKDEKGLSKGFGFMNYENPDDARRATEAMNGSQFGSKNLYVARAQKKVEREKILQQWFVERCMEKNMKYKGSNIYVKNINDSVSDEKLRGQFSACGTITSAKVMRDDKGKSKGFGFVCFSTLDEAVKAVNSFHGRMFHGKPLYVAFAQRKDVRQGLLQLQHTQKPSGLAGPSAAVTPGALSPIIHTGVVYHHPMGSTTFYQRTHVSGQEVLHSDSISAKVSVI